jgi:hypothetical protein
MAVTKDNVPVTQIPDVPEPLETGDTGALEAQMAALQQMLDANMGSYSGVSDQSLGRFQAGIGKRAQYFARFGMRDPAGAQLAQQAALATRMLARDDRRRELEVQMTKALIETNIQKLQFEENRRLNDERIKKMHTEVKIAENTDARAAERHKKDLDLSDARINNTRANIAVLNAQAANMTAETLDFILRSPKRFELLTKQIQEVEAGIKQRNAAADASNASAASLNADATRKEYELKKFKDLTQSLEMAGMPPSQAYISAASLKAQADQGGDVSIENMIRTVNDLNMSDVPQGSKLNFLTAMIPYSGQDEAGNIRSEFRFAEQIAGEFGIDVPKQQPPEKFPTPPKPERGPGMWQSIGDAFSKAFNPNTAGQFVEISDPPEMMGPPLPPPNPEDQDTLFGRLQAAAALMDRQ